MKLHQGFTLIELLTVMALIGLLCTLALPSFQGLQQRSQRALAKVALMKAAAWLERSVSTQGSYPSALPEAVWQSSEMRYRLELQSQTNTFMLHAVPTGAQSSDPCATLSLNQAGERGVVGASVSAGGCWGR